MCATHPSAVMIMSIYCIACDRLCSQESDSIGLITISGELIFLDQIAADYCNFSQAAVDIDTHDCGRGFHQLAVGFSI